MIRAIALAGLFGLLLWSGPLVAQTSWTQLPDASSIKWETAWKSNAVHGGFERFSADIRFDPDAPESGTLRVEVDVTSIYLEGQDARQTLTGPDWFAASDWPRAVFESTSVRKSDGEDYVADGTLTIRGQSVDVSLPFSLDIRDGKALAEGSLTLDRRAFNIGGGMFNDDVADQVTVTVTLAAQPAS